MYYLDNDTVLNNYTNSFRTNDTDCRKHFIIFFFSNFSQQTLNHQTKIECSSEKQVLFYTLYLQ